MESNIMKTKLNEDDISFLKSLLKKYEPYDLDDPRLEILDDKSLDDNRYDATIAKKVLIKYGLLEE